MADKTRIYKVTNRRDQSIELINAATPAQARNHAARSDYDVKVATPKEVGVLVAAGKSIVEAGAEDTETETLPGVQEK